MFLPTVCATGEIRCSTPFPRTGADCLKQVFNNLCNQRRHIVNEVQSCRPGQVLCHSYGTAFCFTLFSPCHGSKGAGQFLNRKELIGLHAAQELEDTRWPLDFDIRGFGGTQAEMEAFVV